jgi:hypothetical protein
MVYNQTKSKKPGVAVQMWITFKLIQIKKAYIFFLIYSRKCRRIQLRILPNKYKRSPTDNRQKIIII